MPRVPLSKFETEKFRKDAQSKALQLFSNEGFSGLTMRRISNELGLSAMALYRYFPRGKSEIIEAIRCQGFKSLAQVFNDVESRIEEAMECLVTMLKSAATFALANPALYRLMFDITQTSDVADGSPIAAARAKAWSVIERATGRCIDEGVLEGDKKVLPHILVAALHGCVAFDISNQPYSERTIKVLFDPLLEILMRGSAPQPNKTKFS